METKVEMRKIEEMNHFSIICIYLDRQIDNIDIDIYQNLIMELPA
jgi:hypothetical protein